MATWQALALTIAILGTGASQRAMAASHAQPPAFVFARFFWPFRAHPERRWQALSSAHGPQVLEYRFDEPAVGLMVGVTGQVEFERAVIGFADGDTQTVDTQGANRERGMYELVRFDGEREVAWVRIVAQTAHRARVAVYLAV